MAAIDPKTLESLLEAPSADAWDELLGLFDEAAGAPLFETMLDEACDGLEAWPDYLRIYPDVSTIDELLDHPLSWPPFRLARYLNLNDCEDLGDEGFLRLVDAHFFARLKRLSVAVHGIGEAAFAQAARSQAFAESRLRLLCMSYNPIGDEGMRALADSGGLPDLVDLRVYSTGITAVGIRALTATRFAPRLQKLDLGNNQFGSEGLRALVSPCGLGQLTSLNLCSNRVRDEGVAALAGATDLSQLTFLDLHGNRITPKGAIALSKARHLEKLEELDLSCNAIGAEGLESLVGSGAFPKLTRIYIEYNGLGCEGARALAKAGQFVSRLSRLDVSENDLGDEGVTALTEGVDLSSLRELQLRNSGLTARSASRLANTPSLGRLEKLNLKVNDLGGAAREILTTSSCLSGLKTLLLDSVSLEVERETPPIEGALSEDGDWLDLGDKGLDAQALQALLQSPRLARFDDVTLSENPLGVEGALALAETTALSHVTELELDGCQLGDEGAQIFAQAADLGCLRCLHLDSNDLGARGAQALAMASLITHIESLDVSWNQLGDEGAAALAKAGGAQALEVLELVDNGIGDQGAQALFASTALVALSKLSLGKNEIGAQSLQVPIPAQALPSLESLHLQSNRLGVEGVRGLVSAPWFSRLHTLDLSENDLGDEGASALASAHRASLSTLRLTCDKLTHKGLGHLLRSEAFRHIEHLTLSHNHISDEGLFCLLDSEVASLTHLDLRHNPISDAGLVALASRSERVAHLSHLCFCSDLISDEGIIALAQAGDLPHLSCLRLSSAQAGDEAAFALARSPLGGQLRRLVLGFGRLSMAGRRALAFSESLPASIRRRFLEDLPALELRERLRAAGLAAPSNTPKRSLVRALLS